MTSNVNFKTALFSVVFYQAPVYLVLVGGGLNIFLASKRGGAYWRGGLNREITVCLKGLLNYSLKSAALPIPCIGPTTVSQSLGKLSGSELPKCIANLTRANSAPLR